MRTECVELLVLALGLATRFYILLSLNITSKLLSCPARADIPISLLSTKKLQISSIILCRKWRCTTSASNVVFVVLPFPICTASCLGASLKTPCLRRNSSLPKGSWAEVWVKTLQELMKQQLICWLRSTVQQSEIICRIICAQGVCILSAV